MSAGYFLCTLYQDALVQGMVNFETILTHRDSGILRILVVALKAHGFHPLEDGFEGIPGYPGVMPPKGVGIQVPVHEASDAKLLAEALLEEMSR